MNQNIESLLELSKDTVYEALDELKSLDSYGIKQHHFSSDIPREIKAEADIIIEKIILNRLQETGIDILSEESGLLVGDKQSD